MGIALDTLTLRGFKSIRALNDFALTNLNVIIGANGAGKSNFVDFFRVLAAMMKEGGLREYIAGNADVYLHNGPKTTKNIYAQLSLCPYVYSFELIANEDGFFSLTNETCGQIPERIKQLYDAIMDSQVYHFHDTTKESGMRRLHDKGHKERLFEDAANIAPFLLMLQQDHPAAYTDILNAIRAVIPFFDNFLLEVDKNENVRLNWRQKGLNNYPMRPSQLSDGSIRFICLATALLQPNPPSTIIIDEPELGLHPEAIALLAELIQSAAKRTQVIVVTQSPILIDYFSIDDIIVVNRTDGASTFERLKQEDFSEWLEKYSLGELWRKNVIVGGSTHE